jgi:hypothetical protein
MLIDNTTVLSDKQAISASGATVSASCYNFGTRVNYDDAWNSHPGNPNPGSGEPVRVLFTVTTAFTGNLTTVTFSLADGTDGNTFTNLIVSTAAIAKASLVQGYQFELIVPDKSRQYLAAVYTTDNTCTGNVSAAIVKDVQTNRNW